jgi:alpha-tubulin suppressor-like RCC1 family protein
MEPNVLNSHRVSQIAAGHYSSFALVDDGTVYAWGDVWGQGSIVYSVPTKLSTFTGIVNIFASSAYALYAMNASGILFAAGRGTDGELGIGSSPAQVSTLTRVLLPAPVVAVYTSQFAAAALTTTGILYAWGKNDIGRYSE